MYHDVVLVSCENLKADPRSFLFRCNLKRGKSCQLKYFHKRKLKKNYGGIFVDCASVCVIIIMSVNNLAR
jgi:hypothetical protein